MGVGTYVSCFNSVVFFFFSLRFKDQVDAAVKELLTLKAEFKQQTGQDYKPGLQVSASPASTQTTTMAATPASTLSEAQEMFARVAQQGELVRKLKSEKAPKVRKQCQALTINYI